jgi:hypothetical protein
MMKDVALENMKVIYVTHDTSQDPIHWLKDVAPYNMFDICITRDTSQYDTQNIPRSNILVHDVAFLNNEFTFVTFDTFQDPMN